MEQPILRTRRQSRCLVRSLGRIVYLPASADHPVSGDGHQACMELEEIPGSTVSFYDSAKRLPRDWNLVAPDDIFLQQTYLEVLEQHPPEKMQFGYLIFRIAGMPVGIAILQLLPFQAKKNIQISESDDQHLLSNLKTNIKLAIASRMSFQLLVCGNMLFTGEHGFHFDETKIDASAAGKMLLEALKKAGAYIRENGEAVSGLMVKDLEPTTLGAFPKLSSAGYHEVPFQPSMILELLPEWATFDDYLDAMSSKYRVRARRAAKKLGNVIRRELTEGEIREKADILYKQYLQIAESADFNMLMLDPYYLPALKQHFPDRFHLYAYFAGKELIGYCTTFENAEELEAHFLGLLPDRNYRHQLYLNMLYDIVGEGIDKRMKRVNFGRTAMAIKSSVGAAPRNLFCYLQHQNRVFNKVLPFLIDYFEPESQWEQRHPFGS